MTIHSKLMRIKSISKNLPYVVANSKYLFILSHMRSRSSVLSHILGSNKDIIGYRELHRSYRDYSSYIDMKIDLAAEFQQNFNNKYLLDKLLHNRYKLTDKAYKGYKPKIIFLLRNPIDTFQSIKEMGEKMSINPYLEEGWILNYYTERLQNLFEFSQKIEGQYFFLDSDDLIKEPEISLKELAVWLDLSENLETSYSTFSKTGKSVYGDPSKIIHSGKLTSTKNKKDTPISSFLAENGMKIFSKYGTLLKDNIKNSNSFKK